MGILIERSQLMNQQNLYRLVVYATPYNDIVEKAVSMNKLIAKKLKNVKQKNRSIKIEEVFRNVLNECPEHIVIKDFDVLFHPLYKIDVLRLLIEARRYHSFALVWPGNIENNRLLYSEESLEDYKTFEIQNYDIVCVI